MILTGETEVLGEKHYRASVVDEWIIMGHWWNDTDRGNLKYWERKLSQCHFVYYKFHLDRTDNDLGRSAIRVQLQTAW